MDSRIFHCFFLARYHNVQITTVGDVSYCSTERYKSNVDSLIAITTMTIPTTRPMMAPLDKPKVVSAEPEAPAAEPVSVLPNPPAATPPPSVADMEGKAFDEAAAAEADVGVVVV